MKFARSIAAPNSRVALFLAALLLASTACVAQQTLRPKGKVVYPAQPMAACIVPTPGISIVPSSFSFRATPPGMTSAPRTFRIFNPGTAPLSISAISVTPPLNPDYFVVGGACAGATLAPGTSCFGDVTFQASGSAGTKSQTIQVYSNAPASPHAVSATGIVGPSAPQPGFSRSPGGTVFVGSAVNPATTTPPVSITISNTGNAPLIVDDPGAAPAPFNIVNGCTAPVAVGGSCTMQFTLTAPPTPGPQSASMSITHNAPGSPHTVNLEGFSTSPTGELEFSPSSVYFGIVTVGGSASTGVEVKNVGATPVTISLVDIAGAPSSPFSILSTTCSVPLNQDETCTIDFDFTPPAVGYYSDLLEVFSDAPGSPAQINIAGDGANAIPAILPTPGFYDFGPVDVAAPTACTTVTVDNLDSPAAPATDFSYQVYGDSSFQLSGGACTTTCGAVIPGGTSCTVGIDFDPSFAGPQSGSLQLYDANSFSYFYADFAGTGFQPGPQIAFDQSFVDFGATLSGTSSAPRTVTVSNPGDADLLVSSIDIFPPFSITSEDCTSGPVIATGTCTITMVFDAPTPGGYSLTVNVNSDAVAGPSGFDVYGTSTGAAAPSVDFYPESLDFGNVVILRTSPPRSISFANSGAAPLTISSIVASGEFSVSHDCPLAPLTLAPGVCCSITSRFNPTVVAAVSENLTITTDALDSPHLVPLTGNGVPPPSLTAIPASLAFSAIVGTYPLPQDIVLKNTGIQIISFTGFNTGGEFSLSDPQVPPVGPAPPLPQCTAVGPSFSPGDSCYVTIWWAPTFLGEHSTNLTVNFINGTGAPLLVPITGDSHPAAFRGISLSTDTMSFAGVVGQSSVAQALTVSNTGTVPLALNGISVSGPFTIANGCPRSLEAGQSCRVDVTYNATIVGRETGDLFVEHDAGGVHRQVHLVGDGVQVPLPKISVSSAGLDFGAKVLGTNNASALTIRNIGNAPLTLGGMVVTPYFTVSPHCPGILQPDQECTADVAFRPSGAGRITGVLAIPSNDPDHPRTEVKLEGTGCRVMSVPASRASTHLCGP
ncbi:MAG: choice-of-anchor D domain-containing protein [Usitatibacter sp.]